MENVIDGEGTDERTNEGREGGGNGRTSPPELSRREVALRLLGAGVGAAFFQAYINENSNGTQALELQRSFTALAWVDSILGVVPTAATEPKRTGDLATNTPSQLKALFGLASKPMIVIAKGCVFAGDGGGGVFYWDANTGLDDGGLFIVPGGNVGTSGAGWRRIWDERINVRWFGVPAVHDASASTHYGIQRAFDVSKNLVEGGIFVPSPVYFPRGLYSISQPIEAYSVNVHGDDATLSEAGGSTVAQLLCRSFLGGEIRGMTFSGGEIQVQIYGTGVNDVQVKIEDCSFSSPTDCAVAMEDFSGLHLIIQKFRFSGPRFFRGAVDNLVIRDGFVEWIAQPADTLNLYKNYCFDILGNALLEEILGAPSVPSQTDSHAWIRINSGTLTCRNVRFGGEGGGAPIVHIVSRDTPSPPVTISGQRSNVEFNDCVMFCSPGITYRYWMRIFDIFPASIRVSGTPTGGLDGSSILVVGAAAADSLLQTHDVEIEFDRLHAQRAASGTFYSDQGTVILNAGRLAAFERREYEAEGCLAQDNLYPVGYYDPIQANLHNLSNATIVTSAVENFHGRSLTIFQVPAGSERGAVGVVSQPLPAMPVGTYCLSLYVKSSSPAQSLLVLDGLRIRQLSIPSTGDGFHRVYGSFWHDGRVGHRLGCTINQLAAGATVSFGFFALHQGNRPAPYTFPGNVVRLDGQNVLPETYYGTAEPTSGSYKTGDLVWNTSPAAGGCIGWVFTTAGTWRPFGRII
jgi:hypothetical protein